MPRKYFPDANSNAFARMLQTLLSGTGPCVSHFNPLSTKICCQMVHKIYQPHHQVTPTITDRDTEGVVRLVQDIPHLNRSQHAHISWYRICTDAYSNALGWPYDVFKWSLIARLLRRKVLFVSVGAGPSHPLSKWLIKSALSLAHYRSFGQDTSTLTPQNDRLFDR